MESILTVLNSALTAAGFGVTLIQVLRSRVPRQLSNEEERALVGAFWQLVSFRVAFSAILELLQRAKLFDTSITLRPDATDRQLFIDQGADDEYKRYRDYYYDDSQHHLRRLAGELKVAGPEKFIDGTDDAWTAEQFRKIQGLVLRLQQKDVPLDWAAKQVRTTLNSVHSNVARQMSQRFGDDFFGVQSPSSSPRQAHEDLQQVDGPRKLTEGLRRAEEDIRRSAQDPARDRGPAEQAAHEALHKHRRVDDPTNPSDPLHEV